MIAASRISTDAAGITGLATSWLGPHATSPTERSRGGVSDYTREKLVSITWVGKRALVSDGSCLPWVRGRGLGSRSVPWYAYIPERTVSNTEIHIRRM